jgi:Family of unknown function (DUF6454)
VSDETLALKRFRTQETVVAANISALAPYDRRDMKHPTHLPEVIQDLMSVQDEEAASQRLVEQLASFSSGDLDIVELGQTRLRLLQSDGRRPQFRVHPQGMEVDRNTGLLYVTAVEIIEERDKERQYWGKGRAHLFECDFEGKTIRAADLTSDDEDEYHPSGMVLIDGMMFIALAQYGPGTSATIIKFNVKDWTYDKLFHIHDHVGLVVPNLDEGELFLGTWGARHYYCTDMEGNIKSKRRTPCADNMEHQDAQLLRGSTDTLKSINITLDPMDPGPGPWADRNGTMMLATGVTAGGMEYFGLDIVDITNWRIKASLRWPSPQHLTKGGWPPFANPTFLWVDSHDRVLALAAPDCDDQQTGSDTTLALYALSRRE